MRYLLTLALIWLTSVTLSGQIPFGLELHHTVFENYNGGELMGNRGIASSITNERNIVTRTNGMTLFYKFTEHHLATFTLAHHKNGRKYDMIVYNDVWGRPADEFYNFDLPYTYFQIGTGYVHRLAVWSFKMPAGVGIVLNKGDVLRNTLFLISPVNFDLVLSAGIQYQLTSHLSVGCSGVYEYALTEYQYKELEIGTFKPRQLGLRFSLIGEFSRKQ